MSNSTQNDEIKQMERAINEGFAESEKFLKGMKTPFDKSSTQNDEIEVDGETYVKWDTQNDWEKRFYDKFPCLMHFRPNKRSYGYSEVGDDVKEFIAKELADARREVITTKIDRLKLYEVIENIYLSGLYSHDKGVLHQYMSDIINVLATLKEGEI